MIQWGWWFVWGEYNLILAEQGCRDWLSWLSVHNSRVVDVAGNGVYQIEAAQQFSKNVSAETFLGIAG
jgi:hypothetical protein